MVAFLATTCSVISSGGKVGTPIKDTASNEEIGRWVHHLSATVMILWSKHKVAIAAKLPAFTYGQQLLSCTDEELAKMMMAYVKPRNKTDKLHREPRNDANNKQSKGKSSSISDSSSKATTEEEMDMELLDFEPDELQDLTGEVIEVVKEPVGKKKRRQKKKKDLPEEED